MPCAPGCRAWLGLWCLAACPCECVLPTCSRRMPDAMPEELFCFSSGVSGVVSMAEGRGWSSGAAGAAVTGSAVATCAAD